MRNTEILRWMEKTTLPDFGSTSRIDRCRTRWQSAEHLSASSIASASVEQQNPANKADSIQVCYGSSPANSSPARSSTTSDQKGNPNSIQTSPCAEFAQLNQLALGLTRQERINYPGSGGAMGPHALSPNTVEEAKAAKKGIERARATNRMAESALSQTDSSPHTAKEMIKPRGETAADCARQLGLKAVRHPKTRMTKNDGPNLLQDGSRRSTHSGGTGNGQNPSF